MVSSIQVNRRWSCLGLGLAMAAGITLPARAHMATDEAASSRAPVQAVVSEQPLANAAVDDEPIDGIQRRPDASAAPVPLVPAAHGDQFTVGFPQNWTVTHAGSDPYLTATAPAEEPAITTEVSWYAEAPGQVVPTLLADIREKGHTVSRYDTVVVDNTTALRLWLTDLPAPSLPHAFITVVGYSDATAVLVSHYETRSTDIDNLLSQVHQSFQRGATAETPDHHAHP